MLRSSAAIVSRMLRLVAASSQQPMLCQRVIASSMDSLRYKLTSALYDPLMPRFPSPANQSRGYARGRPVISEDDDDDDEDDEFEDKSDELTDSEIDDDDVFDVDEDEDEEGDGETHRGRK